MSRYQEAADSLRKHYDATASRRDESERAAWKLETRQRFLTLLQAEGKRTVLEIGAGSGHGSLYFKHKGLDV